MTSFINYLKEMAPPADWDREIFKKSYKKQIDYAVQRAVKLGSGSSRVVFEIEYEGRPTVLKIAKNVKGLAQNEKEADYGLYNMYPDITVPLIDHDDENEMPRWIHLEKAEKMSKAQFKASEGFTFIDFGKMIQDDEDRREGKGVHGRRGWGVDYTKTVSPELQEQIMDSEIYNDVIDLCGNFDIRAGDLVRTANWGMYKGHPVIIDLGFDSAIAKQYYGQKI